MKKSFVLFLLFISAAVYAQNKIAEDTIAKPVITEIGKPAGEKTEIKINKDGGSIGSSDGMVELIIPAGAVSKKTTISIQPITNLIANGSGKAYRFEPSGILFQKPVRAIFHYDEKEIKDSVQLLLGIAMQDDKGQWFSLKKSEVDTTAKIISGEINHFSDWGKFQALKLYPPDFRLKVKKQLTLTIDLVTSEEDDNTTPLNNSGDDDLLSPLIKRKISWTPVWKANEIRNGNTREGTIDGSSLTYATYTAPADLPPKNPVEVTADLKGLSFKYRKEILKDLSLVSNILIYDDAYEVTMISESVDPGMGTNLGAVIYKDKGSFVVAIKGRESRIIEKVNNNTVASLGYSGGCCYDYKILKPGTGNIHIAGNPVIKVTPATVPGKSAMVEISFSRFPTIFPLFQVTCQCPGDKKPFTSTNGAGVMMMGPKLPAFPQFVRFEAKEGEQTILELGKPGDPIYAKFTVKQVKEIQ